MDTPTALADRLKQLCEINAVSMNKMLVESGAGARLYYNLLRGSYPSIDKVSKIADYFGCTLDYLAGRSDSLN